MPRHSTCRTTLLAAFAGIFGAALALSTANSADQVGTAAANAIESPAALQVNTETTPQFNRDIRPILAETCFTCHGPDNAARKAGLRLDQDTAAKAKLESGDRAIVPGDIDASELLRRIRSTDPDVRMPPPDSHKSLTAKQIAMLERWVKAGAPWQRHWSFEPLRETPLPVNDAPGAATAIDVFIQQRLAPVKLAPAPPADRVTLIRRMSFDLIGFAPDASDVASFTTDESPDAVERLADRLLAAPQFGERWAVYWLDLARYGDSCGYHSDNDQSIWPYRDYVIAALNADMPFDRFTREQLAGDLLPNATREQQIATGYNRLNKTTEEGGAQAAEYLEKYAADRVRTTAGTWLGLTLGCAECHDHKYDPITARDFYSFAAFFADVEERGVYASGRREPEMLLADESQLAKLRELDKQIADLDAVIKAAKKAAKSAVASDPDGAKKQAAELTKQRAQLATERKNYERSLPRTLVTVATKPREMRILPRGNWQDRTGPIVTAALPVALAPISESRPLSRLDLANWLTSRDNPLTARVFVNRAWKILHGTGLSRQLDDLGTQGQWPSHPELLDHLALDFSSDWQVKRLLRGLVASQTYRQSSVPSAEALAADPQNRLVSRQGRWRLDAEMIRDHALAAADLISLRIGGPSVKPYQPEGYWRYLSFPARTWVDDVGESQYRRGLYTHWQRTFLHPSLLAFDATSREECTAERQRSSTPKAALALLNDPTYVEAARGIAVCVLRYQPNGIDGKDAAGMLRSRLELIWKKLLSRDPTPQELSIMRTLYEQQSAYYANHSAEATALLSVGQLPKPADLPAEALAPWINVARAILNLQETTTRN